jgi:hypothetical protein
MTGMAGANNYTSEIIKLQREPESSKSKNIDR